MLRLRRGWIAGTPGAPGSIGDLLVSSSGAHRITLEAVSPDGTVDLDCDGCWVSPGWVDLRSHLREPGEEHKETIASGLSAAAAGGYTAVCALPSTRPVHDVRAVTEQMMSRAAGSGARLWPFGAITKGLKGRELAEMADMKAAGIVGVSDDFTAIRDTALLRRAMEYARTFDLVIALHCDAGGQARGAMMHDGVVSTELGLPGSPASDEVSAVATALELAAETGARVHISHVSSGRSAKLIRQAKAENLKVSADVSPHHLTFCDEALRGFDPQFKVVPPLRSSDDRRALIDAVNDGTINAIATDHAPHAALEKSCEFANARFGVIGLELAAPSICALIDSGELEKEATLRAAGDGAASLLGQASGFERGDVSVIDPNLRWTVSQTSLMSKSANTPFLGDTVRGAARFTIVGGELIYKRNER
ncbi:MAG: dihydroorotase [Polyangiales bacterium]